MKEARMGTLGRPFIRLISLVAAENFTYSTVFSSLALENIQSDRLVAGYQERTAFHLRFFHFGHRRSSVCKNDKFFFCEISSKNLIYILPRSQHLSKLRMSEYIN